MPTPLPDALVSAIMWLTTPIDQPLSFSIELPAPPQDVRRWFALITQAEKMASSAWAKLCTRLQDPVLNFQTMARTVM